MLYSHRSTYAYLPFWATAELFCMEFSHCYQQISRTARLVPGSSCLADVQQGKCTGTSPQFLTDEHQKWSDEARSETTPQSTSSLNTKESGASRAVGHSVSWFKDMGQNYC